ncbi:MAG: TonB-dependent receptor family protein [Saprospiraceae bacterium]|nr:TonB-dependent receptor family protein [Saprospiraceae bacterium]
MKIFSLTISFIGLLVLSGWAQPLSTKGTDQGEGLDNGKGIVLGQVIDQETSIPLDFATISLLAVADSAIVTGGITDEQGKFAVEAPYGTYIVKIEYISYLPVTLPPVTLKQGNRKIDLGVISISPSAEILAEVEVVGEKSEMQFGLDKRIFNVGKDLSNKGGSAEDILDNIPSVSVDVDGNVSLRGSENVRILVDGKPSGLIGVGDTDGLKSLPASMIQQVEVITNASARYDAEGTAGIINLVLKKDRKQGVNGSVDLTVGDPRNYGAALNMNVRKNAVNFFLNYGLRDRKRPGGGFNNQEFFGDVSIPFTEQTRSHTRGGVSHSFRGGLDLFLTDNDIVTGAIVYRIGDDYSDALTRFRDFNSSHELFEITDRIQDEIEDETNLEYELNYEHKFAEKGRKLTASMKYRDNSETESADYIENYFDANEIALDLARQQQRSVNDEGASNTLFQIDYVHPYGKESKLELGGKISLRDIDNNYLVEELSESQVWENLVNLSNHFLYAEDIYAVYGIYGNKIDQWSYQVGLRAEHSNVITELQETNEVNDRSYTNLFPSAHLTYQINEGNALQWSYSRRITRPRFWYLNPFFTFADDRNLFGGNPNLDPEFTSSYEFGYLKYWDNVTFGSSLYYRKTTGVIDRIVRLIGDGITRRQPENLSTRNSVGIELTTTADVNKWWRVDGSVNIFSSRTEGEVDGKTLEAESFSWRNRVTSKMKFWKDAEFQLRFDYRAPRNTTQGKRKSSYALDFGLSKDLMKRNATLTLSVRDLLDTRRWRSETFTDDFFMESEYSRHPRSFTVSFNYRLNQKKRRARQGRGDFEGGGEEGAF